MAEDVPPERPSEVEPGLWVCSEAAVPAALADRNLGITHLISIGYPPPENPAGAARVGDDEDGGVKTLRVTLEDDEDGDLLTQIPHCVAFIQDALRLRDANRAMAAAEVNDAEGCSTPSSSDTGVAFGGALVHCHAGVSRSCAVIAAHVMKTRGMDPPDALDIVRRAHPHADPNRGFVAQLELWRSMDCKLNMADEAYKLYSVARLAREREYRGYVDATDVQPAPGAERASTSADAEASSSEHHSSMHVMPFSGASSTAAILGPKDGGGAEAGVMIRCRRCRRLVARGANLLPHVPGQGIDAFSWRKRHKMEAANRDSDSARLSGHCQNLFVQPIAWMRGVEDGSSTEGKLCCPKCEQKIGAFNWAGCQCGCGAWVTPAFYLQTGKVDLMAPPAEDEPAGSIAGVVGVRTPRLVASRPAVERPSLAGKHDA